MSTPKDGYRIYVGDKLVRIGSGHVQLGPEERIEFVDDFASDPEIQRQIRIQTQVVALQSYEKRDRNWEAKYRCASDFLVFVEASGADPEAALRDNEDRFIELYDEYYETYDQEAWGVVELAQRIVANHEEKNRSVRRDRSKREARLRRRKNELEKGAEYEAKHQAYGGRVS